MNIPYLDAAEVARLLDYPALIQALRAGFAADWTVPARHHYSIPMPGGEPDQTLLLMPAWDAGKSIGVKLATITPGNGARGLPAVQAVYFLLDGATGAPLALLDGATLTIRRTAAASALAAGYLARPDATTMLMVGAGAMCRPLIEAHCAQRRITRVLLWARDDTKCRAKVRELAAIGLPVEPALVLKASAGAADLISCATLSREPLIRGAWLKPGCHLDLVGAFTPEMREVDDGAIGRASLFCDTREGAMKEGGDLVQPLRAGLITEEAIKADLRDLVCHRHKGRMSEDEITLFKSVGTATEDFAAARLALERAGIVSARPG